MSKRKMPVISVKVTKVINHEIYVILRLHIDPKKSVEEKFQLDEKSEAHEVLKSSNQSIGCISFAAMSIKSIKSKYQDQIKKEIKSASLTEE